MIPKAKTPPKVTRVLPPRNFGKLSTANGKKTMNNMIKKAAAILAANKNKSKPVPRRRPGVVRPNPVPEIKPTIPELGPTAQDINTKKINKYVNGLSNDERNMLKVKTPTPVRLKEKFSFVNVKGKTREFVRKFAYERALAKNKAERTNANNKQFMELMAREKNTQRKLANMMNKTRPLKNGPLDPAVAYALNTPKNTKKINKYVNGLSNDERNILKKKICKP